MISMEIGWSSAIHLFLKESVRKQCVWHESSMQYPLQYLYKQDPSSFMVCNFLEPVPDATVEKQKQPQLTQQREILGTLGRVP